MKPNKKTPTKEIPQEVLEKLLHHGLTIARETQAYCRNFSILRSPLHKDTLILRWTTIDLEDVDRPLQCYQYHCFYPDGTSQGCSIHYDNQSQANAFFLGLELLYSQQCATDPIL